MFGMGININSYGHRYTPDPLRSDSCMNSSTLHGIKKFFHFENVKMLS